MEKTGTCKHCGINLYEGMKPNPKYMPCGVNGCPYETVEEQRKNPFKFDAITGNNLFDGI